LAFHGEEARVLVAELEAIRLVAQARRARHLERRAGERVEELLRRETGGRRLQGADVVLGKRGAGEHRKGDSEDFPGTHGCSTPRLWTVTVGGAGTPVKSPASPIIGRFTSAFPVPLIPRPIRSYVLRQGRFSP